MTSQDTGAGKKHCPKCYQNKWRSPRCSDIHCPCHQKDTGESCPECQFEKPLYPYEKSAHQKDCSRNIPTTTTGEVPKADVRPSTDEWYKTTLAIKKFCEEKEIHVGDTAYGWLSTFFHEMFSTLIAAEREKALEQGRKEADWWGERLEDARESGRTQTKDAILARITEMPTKFPERESDEYDAGYAAAFTAVANETKKI